MSHQWRTQIAENAFHEVKAAIKVAERIIEETLHERSHKARLKTGHEAEDMARQHDALRQQWYYRLRTTKRHNMERERKRLVAQGRTKGEDMLRNIKPPYGPEHEKQG